MSGQNESTLAIVARFAVSLGILIAAIMIAVQRSEIRDLQRRVGQTGTAKTLIVGLCFWVAC